jgi:hypothetical protein
MDLLLGLVHAELSDPEGPEALVFLGPVARMTADIPSHALGKGRAATLPVFDLQFQATRPLGPTVMHAGAGKISSGAAASIGVTTTPGGLTSIAIPVAAPVDAIERVVSRLKGQIIPIRTPHELADAIQRVNARLARHDAARVAPVKAGPQAPGGRAALSLSAPVSSTAEPSPREGVRISSGPSAPRSALVGSPTARLGASWGWWARGLLPVRVMQRCIYRDAAEVEQTTVFANCRQFRGQSPVTFFLVPVR